MKLGQVIKRYRKENKVSMETFSKISGISKGYISMLENDKNPQSGKPITPSIDMYENVAKGMNISIEALMSLTKGENIALIDDNQYKWIVDEVIPTANIISHDYPYLDEPISAGTPETFEHVSSLPTISIADCYVGKYAGDRDVVIMKVNGESMNKVIPNGSFIAVKRNIDYGCVSNGDIIVAYFLDGVDRGGYTIKRIYKDDKNDRVILRPGSTDPEFVDIIVDKEKGDALSIIGKVIAYNVIL